MIPTSTHATVQLQPHLPADADAIVAFIHKEVGIDGAGALPPEARAALRDLLDKKLVTGKSNQVSLHLLAGTGRQPNRTLLVVGLGNARQFSAQCLREAGGVAARAAAQYRLSRLACVLPSLPPELPGLPKGAPAGPGDELAVEALAQGFLLGSFDFQEYKGTAHRKPNEPPPPALHATIVAPLNARTRAALARARAIAEGQNFARTIASRPGNNINPPSLAAVTRQMARQVGLGCRILDEKEMKRLGMGGILAVGAGSAVTPPRMIVLEYRPPTTRIGRANSKSRISNLKPEISNPKSKINNQKSPPLLVVGKAITFDTGGISIKPADKMGKMIFDKCGGMAVLGLMLAIARLKPPVPVVGILASAENHISDTAYRPGDILRMYNGVTVDVTNTDAEGRLVLADALAWGIETYQPSAVVDLATLTGGVIVALGKTMAGIMGNNDELFGQLQSAADRAGEKIWRLPLGEEQREQMKADAADLVNSAGREGHPLQGAAFLSYFVPENLPWAHLDIAGVSDLDKESPPYGKGATGWGVRTLVEWVQGHFA